MKKHISIIMTIVLFTTVILCVDTSASDHIYNPNDLFPGFYFDWGYGGRGLTSTEEVNSYNGQQFDEIVCRGRGAMHRAGGDCPENSMILGSYVADILVVESEDEAIQKSGYYKNYADGGMHDIKDDVKTLLVVFSDFYFTNQPKDMDVEYGEELTLSVSVDGRKKPERYRWYNADTNEEIQDSESNVLTLSNVTSEMDVYCIAYYCDSFYHPNTHRMTQNTVSRTAHIGIKERTQKDDDENASSKTPEEIEAEKKTKDTLPAGTIQGIGGKKDFNFKALNPETRDVNNQTVYAEYYANKMGYKSEMLISKDIYAPYGQTKDTKWSVKTISWKNTGAGYGDIIYVVWYCQEAKEMQFIKADVLSDGTVVFTIPKSGDVSTVSIVKLSK